jgi:hypothetical protein
MKGGFEPTVSFELAMSFELGTGCEIRPAKSRQCALEATHGPVRPGNNNPSGTPVATLVTIAH